MIKVNKNPMVSQGEYVMETPIKWKVKNINKKVEEIVFYIECQREDIELLNICGNIKPHNVEDINKALNMSYQSGYHAASIEFLNDK